MSELVEFKLDDGSTVYVEVDEPRQPGLRPVSRSADETVAFQSAIARIKPMANQLVASLREMASKPDSVEVSFGIKLSGKVGAFIASTGTEASFNVKLTWKSD